MTSFVKTLVLGSAPALAAGAGGTWVAAQVPVAPAATAPAVQTPATGPATGPATAPAFPRSPAAPPSIPRAGGRGSRG
jgi:hypothetical protein